MRENDYIENQLNQNTAGSSLDRQMHGTVAGDQMKRGGRGRDVLVCFLFFATVTVQTLQCGSVAFAAKTALSD